MNAEPEAGHDPLPRRPRWWSLAPDRRFVAFVLLSSAAVFAECWWLVNRLLRAGFYGRIVMTDVPVYQFFGDAVASGQVPYRDFPLEYPPGALPVFVLPSLFRSQSGDLETYAARFETLMLLFGILAVAAVLLAVRQTGARRGQLALAVGFVAISPLLIGPVIVSRYDLWPALLTAASLAAFSTGRYRVGAVMLGVATTAKLFPAVLVPLMAVHVWREVGGRELRITAALFTGTFLVLVTPFVLIAPDGFLNPVTYQLGRPLQIESLGAGLLVIAHHVLGLPLSVESNHGLDSLAGPLPQAVKSVEGVLQALAVLAVWAWFSRGRADMARLLVASAAAIVVLVAFDYTVSPQYLIWLIPVVPLVGGQRGLVATGILAAALLLTASYFPGRYADLVSELDLNVAWTVLARDVSLVLLAFVLLGPWAGRSPNSDSALLGSPADEVGKPA